MSQEDSRRVLARRVRLALGGLDGLAVSPGLATVLAEAVASEELDTDTVGGVVAASPALSCALLSAAHDEGLGPAVSGYDLDRLVRRLPRHRLERLLLAVRTCAEPDVGPRGRAEALRHAVATARSARHLARLQEDVDPDLAYVGGLLHDIGKLALREVMPKGYARIEGGAAGAGVALCRREREQLGLDHCQIGASLARRWHLPGGVERIIRLHHRGALGGRRSLNGDLRIAATVELADCLSRDLGLGAGEGVSTGCERETLCRTLGLSGDQVAAATDGLSEAVADVCARIGLSIEEPGRRYAQALQGLTLRLHSEGRRRRSDDREHDRLASVYDQFVSLVQSVDGGSDPLDVAREGALCWQRCFQTGKVCVLLYPEHEEAGRRVVVLDELAQDRPLILDPDLDDLVECPPSGSGVALGRADDWDPLFDELEIPFALERTRAIVLRSGGAAVGALAFELTRPGDATENRGYYESAAGVLAHLLHLALAREATEDLADVLIDQGEGGAGEAVGELGDEPVLEAVAEVAAGLAHELNNPLAVVAGRAQLLLDADPAETQREALQQIETNAREMARLVESLLGFAEPATPRRESCDVSGIVEESLALAAGRPGPSVEVDWSPYPEPAAVAVDSAQIASALANVIANAVQASRASQTGVVVRVAMDADEPMVSVQVRDQGPGMDEATRRRAAIPFFSAQPAGRRRGLGLAYAARLVQINGGHLVLDSTPGQGTTVTLRLPRG